MSSSSSSSTNDPPTNDSNDAAPDPRDPSGFLKNLDSTSNNSNSQQPMVVKIVGTARDDLNGLLGFCTAYNRDRERYMVRMASIDRGNSPNATVMALKPANLARASTLEGYTAKFQQLRTDPRIRQKLAEYYGIAASVTNPLKPEHCAGALLAFLIGMVWWVGVTKTIVVGACGFVVGSILVDDVVRHKKPWRVVASNFPSRSNTVLSKHFPKLRGKMSDPVAAGVVGLLVAYTVWSVAFGGGGSRSSSRTSPAVPSGARLPPQSTPGRAWVDREVLEEFYNLGFGDAMDGKDRGASFAGDAERLLLSASSSASHDSLDDDDGDVPYQSYSDAQLPASSASSPQTFVQRLVSVRTAGSLFYLYRTAMQIGVDHSTGIFSFAQLFANIQHSMPPWQKGMLAFSCYNLVSNLLF